MIVPRGVARITHKQWIGDFGVVVGAGLELDVGGVGVQQIIVIDVALARKRFFAALVDAEFSVPVGDVVVYNASVVLVRRLRAVVAYQNPSVAVVEGGVVDHGDVRGLVPFMNAIPAALKYNVLGGHPEGLEKINAVDVRAGIKGGARLRADLVYVVRYRLIVWGVEMDARAADSLAEVG